MTDTLPWRGIAPQTPARPVDLTAMPLTLDGRARKRWRYAGVYGERLMLCAGVVQVGPFGQTFWAVWDREREALRERTRLWRGTRFVRLPATGIEIHDGTVDVSLTIADPGGTPVETASPAGGRAWMWTRKRGAVRFRGQVRLDGETIALDELGVIDESAGYHPRHTDWCWSAGVGALTDGRPVGWNLVTGIHDDADASERTIWVDGAARQAPAASFSPGLDAVTFAGDGARLGFASEAVRARRDDLGLFRSDYVQPFGAFTGTLPGGLELAAGRGVMERHSALW